MNKKRRLTTKEVAKRLSVCVQRINQKFEKGHFPHADYCECGRTIMIPEEDLKIQPGRMERFHSLKKIKK